MIIFAFLAHTSRHDLLSSGRLSPVHSATDPSGICQDCQMASPCLAPDIIYKWGRPEGNRSHEIYITRANRFFKASFFLAITICTNSYKLIIIQLRDGK